MKNSYIFLKGLIGLTIVSLTSVSLFSCNNDGTNIIEDNIYAHLTIEESQNGRVFLNDLVPDDKGIYNIEVDTKITFNVIPNEGYVLDSLIINGLDITDTLSFNISIASEFVVTANFSKEFIEEEKGIISISEEIIHGSISFKNYENHAEVPLNSEIEVEVVPETNYQLSSLTVNSIDILSTKKFIVTESIEYIVDAEFRYVATGENPDWSYLYDNNIEPSRGRNESIDSYYEPIRGLKGEALKEGLHEIIDDHLEFSYNSSKNSWLDTDVLESDTSKEYVFYQGALNRSIHDSLNREHVWAKSHGDFENVLPMHSDYHNLHGCHVSLNSTRGNLDFGEVDTSKSYTDMGEDYDWSVSSMRGNLKGRNSKGETVFEPKDEFKGDTARTIFYMAVRYEGDNGEIDLEVDGTIDQNNFYDFTAGADGLHGNFEDLYEWATSGIDPISDYEMHRNNEIDQNYQRNRNPFIDHPEFIIMIYDKNYNGPGALM